MHYPANSFINWVIYSGTFYHLKCCYLFVVLKPSLQASLDHALARSRHSLQPHTRKQYERQFRLYLAFVISRGLTVLDEVTTVLLFLEFLATNGLSSRVIVNYVSALKFAFDSYGWSTMVFESPVIRWMLRGIKFSISKQPSPKGVFSFHQICHISYLCDSFDNPFTYRLAFLLGFYGFLRISNVAPPFTKSFSVHKHFQRQDVVLAPPGVHLNLKWAKNIQAPERTHTIKLPAVQDPLLCPTQSVTTLLTLVSLPPSAPLLVFKDGSLLTQSLLRKRLATILKLMDLPLLGFGFHTFCRSGATLAFDSNIPLHNIKNHGVWNSDAVWSYISDNTSQALQVPLLFQHLANSLQ